MAIKMTPRHRIKEVKNSLKENGYNKIPAKVLKETINQRYNTDYTENQIRYYLDNLELHKKNKRKDLSRHKDKIKELNNFFSKLRYFSVKGIYQLVKDVYQYHNKDIKEFDFKSFDTTLNKDELRTSILKRLYKYGLLDMNTRIDLNINLDFNLCYNKPKLL